MARTKISEFSATPASNTDIDSIFIGEGMAPSNVNDAIRELMAQLKDWQSGTSNDPYVVGSSGSLTLNQGTANGVAYLNGSKVVTSGSALTFNGTTLGITYANNSFVEGLNVTNSTNGANAQSRINITNSAGNLLALIQNSPSVNAGTAFVGTSSTQALTFGTSYTETMRLDSAGNLGLGVTPSAWSGYKVLQAGIASFAGGSSGAYLIQDNAYTDNSGAGWKYINSSYAAAQYYAASGAHVWRTAPSGTAGNAITFTQAMTLDASGNLLVGTTASQQKLTLQGEQRFYNPAGDGTSNVTLGRISAQVRNYGSGIANNNFASIEFCTDPSAFWYRGDIRFFTNGSDGTSSAGTERARIDSSGNLLVGKTSSGTEFSAKGTQLSQDGGTYFCRDGNPAIHVSRLTSDGSVVSFHRSGTAVGNISVTTTATAYNTSSDYRLKNITGNLTGYKERLMSLQPKQGTWIVDGSEFRGFLAHDFAGPYRASVTGEKDAVDAEGKPVMQAMQASSSEVMADLVAIVKELVTENASLKARLDAANL